VVPNSSETNPSEQARRILDRLIAAVPLRFKVVYRGPIVVIAFLLAILLTIVGPFIVGLAVVEVLRLLILSPEVLAPALRQYAAPLFVGLMTAYGGLLGVLIIYGVWSETAKAIGRFIRLLRSR
jgi:uncharacterized membrane protein